MKKFLVISFVIVIVLSLSFPSHDGFFFVTVGDFDSEGGRVVEHGGRASNIGDLEYKGCRATGGGLDVKFRRSVVVFDDIDVHYLAVIVVLELVVEAKRVLVERNGCIIAVNCFQTKGDFGPLLVYGQYGGFGRIVGNSQ